MVMERCRKAKAIALLGLNSYGACKHSFDPLNGHMCYRATSFFAPQDFVTVYKLKNAFYSFIEVVIDLKPFLKDAVGICARRECDMGTLTWAGDKFSMLPSGLHGMLHFSTLTSESMLGSFTSSTALLKSQEQSKYNGPHMKYLQCNSLAIRLKELYTKLEHRTPGLLAAIMCLMSVVEAPLHKKSIDQDCKAKMTYNSSDLRGKIHAYVKQRARPRITCDISDKVITLLIPKFQQMSLTTMHKLLVKAKLAI
ncbi:hypothetical protein VNO77_05748 [Canavalia gladiata]|uniref:Uncharacterized protein n=1 Tax=Canavalia gladiata TaxID=3824 RepID=A0AAN9MYX5_CANGL